MSTKTKHYQLNQYEPGDNFLRTDFNEDNTKIDAALGRKCEIVIGTYTGDGQDCQDIILDFRPKAVFITDHEGKITDFNNAYFGGLVLDGYPAAYASLPPHMEVIDNGFRVYWTSNYQNIAVNKLNTQHRFLAFK